MRRVLTLVCVLVSSCAAAPIQPDAELEAAIAPPRLKLGEVSPLKMALLAGEIKDEVEKGALVIILDIDSPGGSVGAGLALIGTMKKARAESNVHFMCIVGGMAASMGAAILELGCDVRLMTPGSMLLFHEPSMWDVGGTEHDLRDLANKLADTNHYLAIMLAHRLGMSTEDFEARIKGRDWWLDSKEALDVGAVDQVIPGL